MKIVHVGAYPPPYGGVASHIKRLDALCREQGFPSLVIDSSGGQRKGIPSGVNVISLRGNRAQKLAELTRYLMRERGSIVHFHLSVLSNFIWGAPFLLSAARHTKRVASLHSGGFANSCESLPKVIQPYLHSVFRQFEYLLVANPSQLHYLVTRMHIDPQRIAVIPAFLPPVTRLPDQMDNLLPKPLLSFLDKYPHVVGISGFARPYYGFHDAIRAIDLLADLSVGLIIHFYTTADEDYKRQIHAMVAERGNVLISDEMDDVQMASLLCALTVYVRATSVDGDSVALREAAYLGRQIVATDCVQRPPGCLLYPFGDPHALAERIRQTISDKAAGIVLDSGAGNGERILDVYRMILPQDTSHPSREMQLHT